MEDCGLFFTQGAIGFGRQACKWFGLSGVLTAKGLFQSAQTDSAYAAGLTYDFAGVTAGVIFLNEGVAMTIKNFTVNTQLFGAGQNGYTYWFVNKTANAATFQANKASGNINMNGTATDVVLNEGDMAVAIWDTSYWHFQKLSY